MTSPAKVYELINSIIRSPVRVNSAAFSNLEQLCESGDLSESNIRLANKAFVYCYLSESFYTQGDSREEYLLRAKTIINDSKKLLDDIVSDISEYFKVYTESDCHLKGKHHKSSCWNTTEHDPETIELYTKISFGIYILFSRASETDDRQNSFQAAYYFLNFVSRYSFEKKYTDFINAVLKDQSFILTFLKEQVENTMLDQRSLSRTNIVFMKFLFDTLETRDIKNSQNKLLKGQIGYLIVLYKAEEYRMSLKKLQERKNEKRKLTFFLKIAKTIDKHTFFNVYKRYSVRKEDEVKIQILNNNVTNIENEINGLLQQHDICNYIKYTYGMNERDSEYVESFISRSDLLFYKTGSTSIILKFTHSNLPNILKLVKPCFFLNTRIQYATKSLKDYYEKIYKNLTIHESSEKYAIMEFIEGNTITEFTTSSNSEDDRYDYLCSIQKIITEIVNSLQNLHASDSFHKDLSKDNIIISSTDLKPTFIDFGQNYVIADVSSADQYADISISIAPEVLSCSVKSEYEFIWSDLYSLGIIVLELYNNKIAKDKNVLATLLDETWKKSPSLAYLIELLIDERVDNRKAICDILNSDCDLLINLLPASIYKDRTIVNKKVVTFVDHVPGTEVQNRKKIVTNHSDTEVSVHYFLMRCFREILKVELSSLKSGKAAHDDLLATIIHEFRGLYKNATSSLLKILANFFSILPLFLSVCFFPVVHKLSPERVFIKDYFSFFKKLSSLCWMVAWFVGIGFFARFFHDTFNNQSLVSSLAQKWSGAYDNFFSFMPSASDKLASNVETTLSHSWPYIKFSLFPFDIFNSIEGIYKNYFTFIYKYYKPEQWDIVLSALIVGITFVMCATPYYRIIFSNISFIDFLNFRSNATDTSSLNYWEIFINKGKACIAEFFVRSTSFIHIIPILIGMCNPRYWATCSWIGVIAVTLNSFINTRYLTKSYKIYTDQTYFVLPISNAVKETVDKFSYWHILLFAYIVVLFVGDFGLRGDIIQDWLMYSFLVAVVNVVKMQFFNCYKEGPGIQSTIYRCYAACLRTKYLTKSKN